MRHSTTCSATIVLLRLYTSVILLLMSSFFTDTAPTEIYTLSYTTLFRSQAPQINVERWLVRQRVNPDRRRDSKSPRDRKSTRLNSSHQIISYAVFCLKKKT